VIVHARQGVKVKGAVEHRCRERTPVPCLLPGEADREQLCVVQREEAGGRQGIDDGPKPVERRQRRGQRDLLFEDQVHERWKARLPRPHRRRPIARNNPAERPVARTQVLDRGCERGIGEAGRRMDAHQWMIADPVPGWCGVPAPAPQLTRRLIATGSQGSRVEGRRAAPVRDDS
jgi:hypothetical protein